MTSPPARLTWLNRGLSGAMQTLRRNPAEVLLGLCAALFLSALVALEGSVDVKRWAPVVLGAPLAVLGAYAASVMHQWGALSGRARWGLTGLVTIAALAYGVWGVDPNAQASLWRYGTLALASVGALSLVPLAIKRRVGESLPFWDFNALLVARVVACVAVCGGAWMGLGLAGGASELLLDVSWPEYGAVHLAIWTLVAPLPWLVAAGMPSLRALSDHETARLGALLRPVCTWLVTPLIGLYLLILYLYNARVLIAGLDEAPSNMMSPLVLVAAALIGAGLIVAEPVRRADPQGAFARMIRWLPAAFLPLLPLAMWAVMERVEQYGWTPFRYLRLVLLIALGLSFGLATARRLTQRAQPLHELIAILTSVAVVCTLGPLSAGEVSWRSQRGRLIAIAQEHEVWRHGALHPTARHDEVANAVREMCEQHGLKRAMTLVAPAPHHPDDCHTLQAAWQRSALRWDMRSGEWLSPSVSETLTRTLPHQAPRRAPLAGHMHELTVFSGSSPKHFVFGTAELALHLEGDALVVTPRGQPAHRVPLSSLLLQNGVSSEQRVVSLGEHGAAVISAASMRREAEGMPWALTAVTLTLFWAD